MAKESNNVPFIKMYWPIINSELDIYEQRILSIIISYEKQGTGISTLSKKAFKGISIFKISKSTDRLQELGLFKKVNTKSDKNGNNPTEYHLNKKRINEYFNCKIYDIKEQVSVYREPEVNSEINSEFEEFLKSKENKEQLNKEQYGEN